ncbi:unannotated protein [freshwater metagenome]|uniref:Unannotated protein n=1 Tax=freshwater metagenome TaxID=449393 RepID=A0A6J7ABB4_9ZZZZ
MRASTERNVAVVLTVDEHLVGVLELARVAVGGDQRHEHHLASLHRATSNLSVLSDLPGWRDERVEAQELLDRRRPQLRFCQQSLTILRVVGQVPEVVGELRGDGVEAGHEHQQAEVEDVLHRNRLAVDPGAQHVADDVFLRVELALLDKGTEVAHDFHHRCKLCFSGTRHVTIGVQDGDLPRLELIGVFAGQTHQVHEDHVREQQRHFRHELATSLGSDRVEHFGEPLAQLRLHLLDCAR